MAEDKDKRRQFVTVGLGATMPFGDHGFVKPNLELMIDPEGDVDQQIADQLAIGVRAWTLIDEELETIITKLISPVAGMPSTGDRVKALESSMATVKTNINRIVSKVREHDTKLTADLSAAVKEKAADAEEDSSTG